MEDTSETLVMRPATILDADLLLEWRNDPKTRQASHNTAEVQRDDHIRWLTESIGNRHRNLFICEEQGTPVGTVRADMSDGVWNLSWTVAPNARGRGVAKRMVALVARLIRAPIRAEVKAGNIASVKVAEHAGMEFLRESDGVLHFRRSSAT